MTRLEAFRKWIAHPTTPFFVYWNGFLLYDRGRTLMLENTPFVIVNDDAVNLATMAQQAERMGMVYLLQKRNGPSDYEYRAYQRKGIHE